MLLSDPSKKPTSIPKPKLRESLFQILYKQICIRILIFEEQVNLRWVKFKYATKRKYFLGRLILLNHIIILHIFI